MKKSDDAKILTDPEEIMKLLQGANPLPDGMQVPPPVFTMMDGRIELYEQGKRLKAVFPVREEYYNPMNRMQGGMIAAAIDNTMGPLSFLVAGPAFTLSFYVDFVRGIDASRMLHVEAVVISRSRTNLILEATASDPRGKIVARASSQFQVLRDPG
ncbi:MAG: PaaI family thioesterase [Leptospiraceae bacterium]|nr:PaaI family thioesterase [Leptospiraceae bacterium]